MTSLLTPLPWSEFVDALAWAVAVGMAIGAVRAFVDIRARRRLRRAKGKAN